jgi:hypothetical protein
MERQKKNQRGIISGIKRGRIDSLGGKKTVIQGQAFSLARSIGAAFRARLVGGIARP